MKVLYLHGLNSQLHQDRKCVLENNALTIDAPLLDYEGDQAILEKLVKEYNPDCVIGSSAGGLAGFYFAALKNIPALLFNPALPFRHSIKNLNEPPKTTSYMQIVLGGKDDIVNPQKTFDYLQKEDFNGTIHWNQQMAHRIPINIFEMELQYFLNKIC